MITDIKNQESSSKKFVRLVQQGIDCWVEAGEIIASEIDKNPNFIDEVCAENKMLTPEIVMRFEQLGRKTLHPRLIVAEGHGVKKLRKLPLKIQQKYLDEPVPVLVKTETGWDTLFVDVLNLNSDQSNQVFGPNGIRTEQQQRLFIEGRVIKRLSPPKTVQPYRIKGNTLIVDAGHTFTKKELALLLAEME